jgi:cytochrome c peroxidase
VRALARRLVTPLAFAAVALVGGLLSTGTIGAFTGSSSSVDAQNAGAGNALFAQGRQTFRYDTFGDQAFWGGALQLHRAIEGAKLGGVGGGVSPKTALAVGLKVDATKIPAKVAKAIKAGKVNLDDPATTLTLLKLNAVVGVKGFFDSSGHLSSMGITCAICHSTVDDSFAKGIGKRLDGWPNRDLNVGAIISLAPNLKPVTDLLGVDEATVKKVLASWGPGKFDAELFMDGKAFRPDGKPAATLIPAAFGMGGVNLHTYTGWGSVTYWNAFVANLEMHGIGDFSDARLDDKARFPIAARAGFGHVHNEPDLITPKLGALEVYQKGLVPPKARGLDQAAVDRGDKLFEGKARCATCHVPPLYTEPGWNLHTPASICTDSFQADRSPTGMYRTTPLRGMVARMKGGFYHDGRFKTLDDVVGHYNDCLKLGLTPGEQADLVQYLKSL